MSRCVGHEEDHGDEEIAEHVDIEGRKEAVVPRVSMVILRR